MTEVPDLRGDFVKVGDTIAYAATDGRSGGIRVGKILKITEAHQKWESWDKEKEYGGRTVPTKLQVAVEHTSGLYTRIEGKSTTIDASLKRFVKVSE